MQNNKNQNASSGQLPEDIRDFIHVVQKRLNMRIILISALKAALACLLISVVWCLAYVIRGHAVSGQMSIFLIVLFLCLWLGIYAVSRFSFTRATEFADRKFNLRDSLQSACEFTTNGIDCPFKKLDIDATRKMLEEINPADFSQSFPSRMACIVALLCCSVLLLAAIPENPEIARKRKEMEDASRRSITAIKDIQEELEKEQKALDEEARKALKKTKVPEKIQDLEAHDNMKDSLKEFARLEKLMQSVKQENDPAADKAYFRELAKMLSRQQETGALARTLNKGEFKKAGKELEKYKLGKNLSAEKLKDKKKALTKLSKALQDALSKSQAISRNSKTGDNITKLSKSISKMCKSGGKPSDKECQSACMAVNKDLDNLSKRLAMLETRQKLNDMMKKLLCKSGSCQSMLRCNSQNGGNCNMPSNQDSNKAGSGTADTFNNKILSEKVDKIIKINGVMGEGESEKSLSEAEAGGGNAAMTMENRKREFRRNAENFVMREDIPEEYKRGVKRYFNSVNLSIDDNKETK